MTEFNEKQIEILQVAEKLFADEGFDGASIRTIAKDAGVNIAMISYYFGSKEKLLEALIMYRTSDMKMQLESILGDDLPPFDKIDRLVDLYINRINRHKCMYQIMHFELSTKKRILSMESFMNVKKENTAIFRKIIQEGQDAGVFRTDIIADLIPATVMGTLVHIRNNRAYFEQIYGFDTEEKFEAYMNTEVTKHIKQTIKALLANEN
ncbi:transcriptional regulator [Flavobacterium akiainvivens]|uniref:Transcriptional regulator n=1 Tax=Flavobacterium akiainvivens TaxID=1202724 RepID=A0A0N0RQC3_9FLAO|nr:TetR family transcriptional regulator [Flavobacterium akiainvivens]KOS04749.1 transcriptional regulator [Flavobacterium akiainvivens]SFQ66723.1 transcriptional regulator, TetR family [Flavobacterium akiainvivens]